MGKDIVKYDQISFIRSIEAQLLKKIHFWIWLTAEFPFRGQESMAQAARENNSGYRVVALALDGYYLIFWGIRNLVGQHSRNHS
jgi:hypothetical protein